MVAPQPELVFSAERAVGQSLADSAIHASILVEPEAVAPNSERRGYLSEKLTVFDDSKL